MRPDAVRAEGEAMEVGGEYRTAVSLTSLRNRVNDRTVFSATSEGQGIGIRGASRTGPGVVGNSGYGPGVRGASTGGVGIRGTSGWIGVEGVGAAGVKGATFGGDAVWAEHNGVGGHAVFATCGEQATAVGAYSNGGIGLRVDGKVVLDAVSGVATIPAGETSVTRKPQLPMTAQTFILLTPRSSLGGRDLWYTTQAAEDRFNDSFTIHMSAARSVPTRVAWLMIG